MLLATRIFYILLESVFSYSLRNNVWILDFMLNFSMWRIVIAYGPCFWCCWLLLYSCRLLLQKRRRPWFNNNYTSFYSFHKAIIVISWTLYYFVDDWALSLFDIASLNTFIVDLLLSFILLDIDSIDEGVVIIIRGNWNHDIIWQLA